MHMSVKSGGFSYIVQAPCSLTSYVEAHPLHTETGQTLGNFIFEEIICRWGTIVEIVTNNGTSIIAMLEHIAKWYHINHIRISLYNSKAIGIVEVKHFSICDTLFKACDTDGAEPGSWSCYFFHTLWAERITHRHHMGCSLYFAAHGVHPILPFDVVEVTSLLPPLNSVMTSKELVACRAVKFTKRNEDLDCINDKIFEYCNKAMEAFTKKFAYRIKDYGFQRGHQVMVCNTHYEKALDHKHCIRYLGPMIFIMKNRGDAYILCKLDGTVPFRPFVQFRVIPYFPHKSIPLPPMEEFLDITPDELDQRIQSMNADPEGIINESLNEEIVEPEEDIQLPDFNFATL
jgi:hypothetical protein